MKKLLALFYFLLVVGNTFSQVSTYAFSETTGTYTAITGGTQLVTTTAGAISYDTDGSYFTLAAGNRFTFNSTLITSVNMTADGALWLNPGATTTGNGTTGAISSTATAAGVICAMNMDLRSTAIAGQVYERRWQDDGTEVIFQWQNVARYSTTSPFVLNERFSFQIRINKSTGVVRVVYGNMTTIVNSTTYQPMVGLRGSVNTDYNNRRLTAAIPDATPNWGAPNGTTAGTSNAHTVRFTSVASCFPVSGLTFVWTPPSCSPPTSLTKTYPSPTSANMSWTASISNPSSGYEWEMRTSGAGGSGATGLTASGTTGAGVVTATTSALTQNTAYILYVRSNCGGGIFSAWAASTSTITPSPPPSNDYCSGATNVPCGTSSLAGTTVGTVIETAPFSLSSSYGVWYTFTGDGQQTTITSTTTFDHSLLFMSGSCSGLSYITNIDNSFSTETYTFVTAVGVQYYIYVAHYLTSSTSTGTFTISRTCTAPPVPPINDNPSGAIQLTIGNTVTYVTYTNVNATNTTTELTPSCAAYVGEDVWFKVIVPQYMNSLDFDTQIGTITDAGMAIYRGTPGALVEIQCDDDSSPNGAMSFISRTDFIEYETIYIRVWEYNGGTVGTFGISVTSPQPLPVELLYFEGTAHSTYNNLKWATASEQNSNYFGIERSIDGETWREVATKQSAGNSTEKINYYHLDNIDQFTIHYYRLVQYDIDGKFEIFDPIALDNRVKEKTIVKYVNLLGQEVGSEYKGVVFEIYEDGTSKKIIR
jgi:hypothetical protein